MLPRDEERRRNIIQRAKLLASSGQCQDWRDIEAALKRAGRPDISEALASPRLRKVLDKECAAAQRQKQRVS